LPDNRQRLIDCRHCCQQVAVETIAKLDGQRRIAGVMRMRKFMKTSYRDIDKA
jgi:hypothetical protein